MPVWAKTFLQASMGPTPMIAGSTPLTAEPRIRASGLRPSDFAYSSSSMTTAAAPSLSGQELPAVTRPSSLKTGFRDASFSSGGVGAGCRRPG